MKLPQREFYTLHEVAARWGCALADISGWSTAGELDVITGIPPTFCGTTRVAGTVVICTMDIVPMFRRCGTGPKNAQLRRLRTEEAAEWLFVTEPAHGVEVSVADLLLRGKQVLKFEDTHDLLRRISGGTGSTSPYDWDGMTKAFLIRIHDRGIPTSKAEMIGDLQDWFVANSNGDDIPSERSIRHHVDDLWKMLPDSLGGIRMAIHMAELARAGMTPDWMPGAVPRCVALETKNNQHGQRATIIVVGTERVKTRGKWRTVELLACPVTWRPHPEQIASAQRGYEDWWQALDWVRDGLIAGGMLQEVEITAAMPKLRPWLASPRKKP